MPSSIMPIRICDLRLTKGERAVLGGVDLTIDKSGITVIMGPNGAGKTLLLRCLHGLIRPDQGQITLGHLRVADSRDQQAMVFQQPVLLRRTALQNLAFAAPVIAKSRPQRLIEALESVHLADRAHQPARMLSGGEQQRLALARALLGKPALLLLDEATASLDPASVLVIESLVKAQSAQGTKVILVSHDQGQARRLADDVVFMSDGQVAEQSPANQFFASPRTPVAKAYLAGEILL
ncbi:ATP-binding cassette domain-containing protein [Marinobacter orientalis]|uniref:Amino acid ABC transporter ATP-binding protein n=1 Tax=Marinobacter orientalis TaxID=1928859 RepID=A0A7Y0RBI3_9GAMM|nr:ATP-binding cassette domain-containing protein [Marinobacter orientalis]NMT63200.1 amino acid ABC transporter ATP-binding protein [Marinobacter orientalis]TGX51854.1 amino acid ABC transporter ATP-binding protein [Marinobacter orientalis]